MTALSRQQADLERRVRCEICKHEWSAGEWGDHNLERIQAARIKELGEHQRAPACKTAANVIRAHAKGLVQISSTEARLVHDAGYSVRNLETGLEALKNVAAASIRSSHDSSARTHRTIVEPWVTRLVFEVVRATVGMVPVARHLALQLAHSPTSAGYAIRALVERGDRDGIRVIIDANPAAGDEFKPGTPVEIRIRDAWVRASYERPHKTSGYHWVQREENALGQRKRQIVGGIKLRRAS